ncbi:putative subtilisin [Colletotrichum sp. SAR 10_75]|nr:putative subtilisin [Colletotrichum sp. SAR 10_75]
MDNDFVVGIGARAETINRYDFAEAALTHVSNIAGELANEKISSVAGSLAAELHIALFVVRSTADPKLQSRIPRLLKDLERVCAKGIMNFAKSSKNKIEKPITEQYFKKLSRFSDGMVAKENTRNGINKTGSKRAADVLALHLRFQSQRWTRETLREAQATR